MQLRESKVPVDCFNCILASLPSLTSPSWRFLSCFILYSLVHSTFHIFFRFLLHPWLLSVIYLHLNFNVSSIFLQILILPTRTIKLKEKQNNTNDHFQSLCHRFYLFVVILLLSLDILHLSLVALHLFTVILCFFCGLFLINYLLMAALSPYIKKVPGLNLSWGLSVWTLHVFSSSTWVLCRVEVWPLGSWSRAWRCLSWLLRSMAEGALPEAFLCCPLGWSVAL